MVESSPSPLRELLAARPAHPNKRGARRARAGDCPAGRWPAAWNRGGGVLADRANKGIGEEPREALARDERYGTRKAVEH